MFNTLGRLNKLTKYPLLRIIPPYTYLDKTGGNIKFFFEYHNDQKRNYAQFVQKLTNTPILGELLFRHPDQKIHETKWTSNGYHGAHGDEWCPIVLQANEGTVKTTHPLFLGSLEIAKDYAISHFNPVILNIGSHHTALCDHEGGYGAHPCIDPGKEITILSIHRVNLDLLTLMKKKPDRPNIFRSLNQFRCLSQ